jgi:hypothetical protein
MNMRKSYFFQTIFLLITLCAITCFIVPAAFAADDGIKAASSNLTPLPGNPQRKAVLDALREELKRIHEMEVLFVVKHLKVKDGWAWLHTLPQSPDGQQHYEDVSALLRMQDGVWKVAELPCVKEGNPECLGTPDYFTGLMQRFEAPAEIFPTEPDGAKHGEMGAR